MTAPNETEPDRKLEVHLKWSILSPMAVGSKLKARLLRQVMGILGVALLTVSTESARRIGQQFIFLNQRNPATSHATDRPPPTPKKRTTQSMIVSTPIFVLSLPKSGTTTFQSYFNCGLTRQRRRESAHHWGKKSNGKRDKLGNCFRANNQRNRPLTEGCGNYSIWIDAGVPARDACFYPGLDALDNIARYYPNATIVVGTRPAEEWLASTRSYDRATLIQRWTTNCPSFPNTTSDQEWLTFYHEYSERIQSLATTHKLRYIEVDITSPNTPRILQREIGIRKSCFQHCRPGGLGCHKLRAES